MFSALVRAQILSPLGEWLFPHRNTLLVLFATFVMLPSSIANAQGTDSPLPIRPIIDERGVNLTTGMLFRSETDVKIGPPDHHGLQYARYWNGVRPIFPTLTGTAQSPVVTFDGRSIRFDLSSSTYIMEDPDGSSLSADRKTFTAKDGTKVRFSPPQGILQGLNSSLGRVLDVTFTDGTVWNYYFDYFRYCTTYCSDNYRPSSIITNTGYQLKLNYKYQTITSSAILYNWWLLKSVIALNTHVESCPQTGICVPSGNWPTAAYDIQDQVVPGKGDKFVSVTRPEGEKFTYVQRTYSLPNGTELYEISGETAPGDTNPFISFNLVGYNNQVASSTENGVTWNYLYDDGKTTITDSEGVLRTITFDPVTLQVLTDTDRNGNSLQYFYCTNDTLPCKKGKVKKITLPEGNSINLAYDARGNVVEKRLKSKTPGVPADIVTTAKYPATCTNVACNKPNWTKDAKGGETDYTYNSSTGGVLTVTGPAPSSGAARPKTTYGYTSVGGISLLSTISTCSAGTSCTGSAAESRTTIGYNTNMLPITTTIAAGDGSVTATTTNGYDAVGNKVTVNGPLSGTADTTTYRYDGDRRVVGVIAADPGSGKRIGQRITYNPDGTVAKMEVGTVTAATDAAWSAFVSKQQLATRYDGYQRRIRDAMTAGGMVYGVTDYTYDALGRLQCVAKRMNPSAWTSLSSACSLQATGSNGPDRITRNYYDGLGRIKEVTTGYGTSSASNEKITTYTDNGKVATLTDGEGNKTTYEYDGFDRLSKTRFPSSTVAGASSTTDYEQLLYDANGNLTSRRLRNGGIISYAYDALNRVTTKAGAPIADVSYSYDLLGHLLTAKFISAGTGITNTYDALGRMLTTTSDQSGTAKTITHKYDAAGNLVRVTHPDGAYFTYGYDVLGRFQTLNEATSARLLTITYTDDGGRDRETRNGVGYVTYGYDPLGRVKSIANNIAGTSGDLTSTFTYNPANQIAAQTRSNGAFAFTDAANVNRTYVSNGLNQYTTAGGASFAYDANGNLASDGTYTYVYDAENRLTAKKQGSTTVASLSYDPLGRLYQTSGGGVTTRFLYDGDQLIEEYNTSGTVMRRYVHGPGIDDPLVWYEGSGASATNRRTLLKDYQGSAVTISDAAGNPIAINTYDEYGIPGSGNTGRFQYTGQAWVPELGMYYYKARMYSPSLGRFMQTDPIGYDDGLNWYNYVGGDPVNAIDPSGTDTCRLVPDNHTQDEISNFRNGTSKILNTRYVLYCDPDVVVPGQRYTPFDSVPDLSWLFFPKVETHNIAMPQQGVNGGVGAPTNAAPRTCYTENGMQICSRPQTDQEICQAARDTQYLLDLGATAGGAAAGGSLWLRGKELLEGGAERAAGAAGALLGLLKLHAMIDEHTYCGNQK